MKSPGWYMIVYDISDKKRLNKIYRIIKKHGLYAQKSVYFYYGNEKQVNILLNKIAKIMNLIEDDLRAYPVSSPSDIWTTGGVIENFPIIKAANDTFKVNKNINKKKSNKKSWLKRIFFRK